MLQDTTAVAVPTYADVGGHHDRVVASSSGSVPAAGSSLTDQLRTGSRAAMSAIFTAHLDAIYNYCYRRTSSWAAAEDLASTVFLEVWRHRRRAVELDGSVLPWLYGIATNVCRNHLRSQRRQVSAMSRLELVDGAGSTEPPLDEQVAHRLDADRRLRSALAGLAELPVDDQDVFVLVCWEQLSYPQAAQALGIPLGTVRSRLARVRRTLRLTEAPVDTTASVPAQENDRV